jgi:hypothetical protein
MYGTGSEPKLMVGSGISGWGNELLVLLTQWTNSWRQSSSWQVNSRLANKDSRWGISVSIVSDYRLDDRGSIPDRCKGFFSLACVETSWGPPSLLPNGYRGSFPRVKRGRIVTLTTDLHLVPRATMSRSYISSLPCCMHGGSETDFSQSTTYVVVRCNNES